MKKKSLKLAACGLVLAASAVFFTTKAKAQRAIDCYQYICIISPGSLCIIDYADHTSQNCWDRYPGPQQSF